MPRPNIFESGHYYSCTLMLKSQQVNDMNMFSEEIAVLQGSLLLYHSKNAEVPVPHQKPAVNIVCDAVKEITHGLTRIHSHFEEDFWKFKVLAILVLKFTEPLEMFMSHADMSSLYERFRVPLFSLPDVGLDLTLDVIDECKLWPEFVMVLHLFPLELMTTLLDMCFKQISAKNTLLRVQLLLEVCKHSLLPMPEKYSNDIDSHVTAVSDGKTSWRQNQAYPEQLVTMERNPIPYDTECMIGLAQCRYSNTTGNTALSVRENWRDVKSMYLSFNDGMFQRLLDVKDLVSEEKLTELASYCMLNLATLVSQLEKRGEKSCNRVEEQTTFGKPLKSYNFENESSVEDFVKRISHCYSKLGLGMMAPADSHLLAHSVECVSKLLYGILQSISWCEVVRNVDDQCFRRNQFVDAFFHGDENLLADVGDIMQNFSYTLQVLLDMEVLVLTPACRKMLQEMMDQFNMTGLHPKTVLTDESLHDDMKNVISRIDRKLPRLSCEDDLHEILQADNLVANMKDSRWLPCLEANHDCLVSVKMIMDLIHAVDHISKMGGESLQIMHRLRQLIMSAFSRLPLVLQDRVLHLVESSFSAGQRSSILCPDTEFKQRLTSAFNRVVKSDHTSHQNFTEISSLALLSPRDVIQKAVYNCIVNKGQVNAILKVLYEFPAICSSSDNGSSLLCSTLNSCLDTALQSATCTENFMQMVQGLLKPFENSYSGPFSEPPLLNCEAFLGGVILPKLSYPVINDALLCLILKLLVMTLKQNEGRGVSEIFWRSQQVPMILCLSLLIDSCQSSVDENFDVKRSDVRELCVQAIDLVITHEKCSSPIKDRDQMWLNNKLKELHWTTQVHTACVFSPDSVYHKKLVPSTILEVCNLPLTQWRALQHDDTQQPVLVDLFLLCRLSDSMAEEVIKHLDYKKLSNIPGLHHQAVITLAQMLPWCSVSEWRRIARVLHSLVTNRCLCISFKPLNLTFVPLENLADVVLPLTVSQVMMEVLIVVQHTQPQKVNWGHLVNSYAAEIKALQIHLDGINECSTKTTSTAPQPIPISTRLFSTGQIFSHVCLLMTILHHELDNLRVLALDWLTLYKTLSASSNSKIYDSCIMAAIQSVPTGINSVLKSKFQSS